MLQLCNTVSKTLEKKSFMGPSALQNNMDSKNRGYGLLQHCPKDRMGEEKVVIQVKSSVGPCKVFTFLAYLCLLESMFSLPEFITDALACRCSVRGLFLQGNSELLRALCSTRSCTSQHGRSLLTFSKDHMIEIILCDPVWHDSLRRNLALTAEPV